MTADRSAPVRPVHADRAPAEHKAPAADGFAELLGGAHADAASPADRVAAYAASSRPAKPQAPAAADAPATPVLAAAPVPALAGPPVADAAEPAPADAASAPAPTVPGFVLTVAAPVVAPAPVEVPVVAAPAPVAPAAPVAPVQAAPAAPVVAEAPVPAEPAPAAPAPGGAVAASARLAAAPAPAATVPAPAEAPAQPAAPQPAAPAAEPQQPVVPAHAPAARAASAVAAAQPQPQAAPQPAAAAPAAAAIEAKAAAEAPVPAVPAAVATPTVQPQPAAPALAAPPVVTQRTAPLHHVPRVTATLLHVASDRGITRARINLRPEDLGGIEVRLQSSAAGITAHLVADSPEAARLLHQAGDDLRRSLEQRDVNLLSLEVSTSGEERRGAQPGAWETQQDDARAAASGEPGADGDAADAPAPVTQTLELPGGLLVDVLA